MAKKTNNDPAKKTNGDKPATERPDEAPAGSAPPQSAGSGTRAASGAELTVLAQYVKDLSFESPGAPQTLQGPGENPELKIGVNVNAGPRGEDLYALALQIEAHAKSEAGVIYNAEIMYGGLFRLRNIPKHLLQTWK